MLQSEKNMSSSAPLWSIDRKMTRQTSPSDTTSLQQSSISSLNSTSSLWDSTPIGKSLLLRLCQREQLSPQLILEDKVFRSAIRLQHGSTYRSQLQFVGTLIVDDETQRLTFVVDRLQLSDSPSINDLNPANSLSINKQLNGEFLIPIRCDNKTGSNNNTNSNLLHDGMKSIDTYCRSSLPIELHQFSCLHGQMSSRLSPSINADLSFDLLTIKNTFKLTPISADFVHILPTALLKNLSSTTGNGVYNSQPHFGYCGLDRMSKNKILLILENDPQACALPLVGIWVSGIVDVQCAFVWAACLRYCLNSSLKQRLRTGVNIDTGCQQSFLLACYSSSSRGQCDFYEVRSMTTNGTSTFMVDYDLWTCSKKIIMPNPPSAGHSHDSTNNTQLPYDFEFKHVYDGPKMHALLGAHTGNVSFPLQPPPIARTMKNLQLPSDISFLNVEIPSDDENDDDHDHDEHLIEQQHHQATLASPNTNGSLFGVPRLPPKQATHQSPSWDSISTTPLTTPRWIAPVPSASISIPQQTNFTSTSGPQQPPPPPPPPMRFSSPAPSTIAPSTIAADTQWKEEMLDKLQSYHAQIQALNTLVAQLLVTQQQQQQLLQQQNSLSSSVRECTKRDVAVQSEPPSPCMSDDVGESASMVKSNRTSPPSPKIDPYQNYPLQQQQTPIITATTRSSYSSAQVQSSIPGSTPLSNMNHPNEPVIDYASLRKSADNERYMNENTPVAPHYPAVRSLSPPPQPPIPLAPPTSFPPQSAPADLNPVDILKPFFQYMASQQQRQQQQQQLIQQPQQHQIYEEISARPTTPVTSVTNSFDPALIQKIEEEDPSHSTELMLQQQTQPQPLVTSLTPAAPALPPPPPPPQPQTLPTQPAQQQQHVTSTTTTGISFISNGLQMQFFNQQSSITTVYPPASMAPAPTTPARVVHSTTSSQQSENDLSIEVRSLAMKYLEDDQLAVAIEYDRQSPTPPSTVRQSPQAFDKSMSFATQKYFEKYGIFAGNNRQQQYYVSSDENDLVIASSPPHQRMLLPLPPVATPPIFTQPQAPHAPQAKILDLSQIRKLPKLL